VRSMAGRHVPERKNFKSSDSSNSTRPLHLQPAAASPLRLATHLSTQCRHVEHSSGHVPNNGNLRSHHSRNAAMNPPPVATRSCSRSPRHHHTQPIPRNPRSFSTRHRVHPTYTTHHTSFSPKTTHDGTYTPPPKNFPPFRRSAKRHLPSPLRAHRSIHPRSCPHGPPPLSLHPCAHPTRKDTISPIRKSRRSGN
jgi:hypothetical protein